MSILKRVISLLLCIAMVIPVLASCDTDDLHNHKTGESTTEQPQETESDHTHTLATAVTENYIEATCTNTGSYDEVVYCSECQEEISRTQKTVDKKPHDHSQKVTTAEYLKTEATCTDSAVYYYSCSCGDKGTASFREGDPLEHIYNQKVIADKYLKSPADCNNAAVYYYSCVCGVKGSTTFTDGEANGHSYSSAWEKNATHHWHKATCEHTTEISGKDEHNYGTDNVCDTCGYDRTVNVSGVTLNFSSLALTVDDVKTLIATITPNNATSQNVTWTTSNASVVTVDINGKITAVGVGTATITVTTADGNKTAQCTVVVSAKVCPHTTTRTERENEVDSTCKVTGTYDEVVYCTTCGDELSRTEKIIPKKTTHTNGAPVHENIVDSTCKDTGSYDEVIYCSVCGVELSRVEKTIDKKTTHTSGEAVEENIVDSTCKEVGSYDEVIYCSVCGCEMSRTEKTIDKKNTHTEGEAVQENFVAPTFEAKGSYDQVIYCSVCGKELERTTIIIPEKTHTAGTAVVENKVDSSCKEPGSYDEVVYCTVCGDELSRVQKTIEKKTTHTEDEAVTENLVDSTCKDEGSYDEVVYCSVCDVELSRTSHSIEKKATHTQASPVQENFVDSTCKAEGAYDEVIYCSVCSVELSREKINVDAIGHTEVVDDAVAPNCTNTGLTEGKHCSACGEVLVTQEIIEANGHDYVSSEVKPTCTEWGYTLYICHCEAYFTDSYVDALGHDFEDRICTVCGDEYFSSGLVFASNGDGTCYVKYIGTCTDTELYIPKVSPEGYAVTSIGSSAFRNCSKLTSVVIPDSITSIGNYAFRDCSGLTSVVIPDSVTRIGFYAFSGCNKLVEVINRSSLNIVAGSLSLGDVAYYAKEVHTGDSKIVNYNDYLFYTYNDVNYLVGYVGSDTELILPDNYRGKNYELNTYAFEDCTSITSVVVGESVKSIGNCAFYGCDSLTSVVIGESVESIGINAFYNCYNLTSITIPDSVTSIGGYAFRDCSGLTSIVIGDSVTSIGASAFSGCTGLTSITIPDSVTSIGESAFSDCNSALYTEYECGTYVGSGENPYAVLVSLADKKLSTYKINENTKIIAYGVFEDCENIKSVTIPAVAISMIPKKSIETIIINGGTDIVANAFQKCTNLKSITIPGSVTSIGASAFSGCTGLTSITIPDSVTSIGESAFSGCTNLTSITIPDSVTSIGESAFSGCTGLTSITIPDSVTSIGYKTFSGCTNLTSITIPDSVTSIGESAFSACTGLTSVTIGNGVTSIGKCAFYNCNSLTRVTIGDSVTSISKGAFKYCYKLIEVINYSNLNITQGSELYGYAGYYAEIVHMEESKIVNKDNYLFITLNGTNYLLGYAGNDTALTLPESYNGESYRINDYAFLNDNIISVTIVDCVTSIGGYAFSRCDSLTRVTIGDNVTLIGSYAFNGCLSLTSVTIGNGVTSIGEYAFYNCTALEEIYFNARAMNDCSANYAFYNAGVNGDGIKIVIGDNVTKIPDYLFYGGYSKYYGDYCYSPKITSVTIGNSVTSIGEYSFYKCISLEEIYFNARAMNDLVYGIYIFDDAGKNGDGTKLVVGANVTKIPDYLFSRAEITNVEFEKGSVCKSIGEHAFYGCSILTDITLPDSVTIVGERAFESCSNLTSVIIGDGVTSIGEYAFFLCKGLTNVVIGNSVTTIGDSAFRECRNLTSIKYRQSADRWYYSITKGIGWDSSTGAYCIIFNYEG